MSASPTKSEQQVICAALEAKREAEQRGYAVSGLVVHGRKYELKFVTEPGEDDLDLIDMRKR